MATATPETRVKSLFVISSYTVAGLNEVGSGGFVWLPEDTTFESALALYYTEVENWKGGNAVVRMVQIADIPAHLDGTYLTNYLDSVRLDEIEFTSVPLATTRLSTATNDAVL